MEKDEQVLNCKPITIARSLGEKIGSAVMGQITPANLENLCVELFGVELERDRLETLVVELQGILFEIKKLRELDLTDEHPVVVFDPEAVYRSSKS